MLIGLISDTHIPDHVKGLPEQLKEVFRDVDLILHAGDIYIASVLDELESIAPVKAAWGDDDRESDLGGDRRLGGDKRLKDKHVLNIDGITIWLTHELIWSRTPYDSKESPDVIVYGHTHQPSVQTYKGVLQVNPGSATFPHYRLELGTVGLLTVNSGKAEAQIIQLQ